MSAPWQHWLAPFIADKIVLSNIGLANDRIQNKLIKFLYFLGRVSKLIMFLLIGKNQFV
jgi:hypothetical protein